MFVLPSLLFSSPRHGLRTSLSPLAPLLSLPSSTSSLLSSSSSPLLLGTASHSERAYSTHSILDHILELNRVAFLGDTRRMLMVPIFILYGGQWMKKGVRNEYVGGDMHGLSVDRNISYWELVGKLYSLVNLDPSVDVMQLKAWFALSTAIPLMDIKNDSDLRFYMDDVAKGSRNLLCVVTKRTINQGCPFPSIVDQVDNSLQENADVPSCDLVGSDLPTTRHTQSDSICDEIRENFTNRCNETTGTSLILQDFDDKYIEGSLNPLVDKVRANYGFDGQETPLVIDHLTTNGEQEGNQKETETVIVYTDRLTGKIIVPNSCDSPSASDDSVKVGDLFNSKRELRCKLSLLAMKKNFEYIVKNSSKNMLYVKCVDTKCKWRLRATLIKDSGLFRVTKFNNLHACSLGRQHHNHRQASSNVIAQLIKSKCEGVGGKYKPNDIIQDVQRELGVNITYDKAWRAREVANNFIRVSTRKCGSCGQIGHNRKKCTTLLQR